MLNHAIPNKARKLTATAIARIKPPSQGQRDIPDTDPRGFGLRVSATGEKSFTFLFRAKSGPKVGKLQRLTLGRVPSTTDLKDVGQALANAREQARTLRTEVERGGDPKARLDAERREALLAAPFGERSDELLARVVVRMAIGRRVVKPVLGFERVSDVVVKPGVDGKRVAERDHLVKDRVELIGVLQSTVC